VNAGSDLPPSPPSDPGNITRILNDHGASRPEALAAVAPLVYDELRTIAHRALLREAEGHTLQTTDLVHEAFIRLVRADEVSINGRAHFFALSAKVMRQILVDWAKARRAAKRGGAREPVPLAEALDEAPMALTEQNLTELITLDDALERLAALAPRQARVVECRFFGGMSVEETAEALDISVATVKREWSVARAWLNHALSGDEGAA
jgi:RNA polymerase sigma factor (TIGR02999 family)